MENRPNLSESIFSQSGGGAVKLDGSEGESTRVNGDDGVAYIWTASSDYGKVLRIGFKKRIASLWLDGHSLRGYADLNMTAFEKILKK